MERLITGIKNLDYILGGGIPAYSLNIISGSPGSGKTIFVQNIIFNSARNGLKSLYLTTISESQLKMVRHLKILNSSRMTCWETGLFTGIWGPSCAGRARARAWIT